MLQDHTNVCLYPMNLYQGNNSKDTSYRSKDFYSSVTCSKLSKHKCKINLHTVDYFTFLNFKTLFW